MLNRVLDDTSIVGAAKIKLEYGSGTLAATDTSSRDTTNTHCVAGEENKLVSFSCTEYLKIGYRAVPQMMVMRRAYKKLPTILGEFGGVFKLMTTVVIFLYSLYSARKMRGYFENQIFGLSEKGAQELKRLVDREDSRRRRNLKNGRGEDVVVVGSDDLQEEALP